jgi:PTH1 family peptidyl-tRNA hydrolase
VNANPKKVYIIVGLGNPGKRYSNTRHNIGFRVIDLWSRNMGVRLTGRRFQARNIRTKFQNQEIILLRPLTFMNQSGESVEACADYYDLERNNVLVVHDDLDLPAGRIRVVRNGGAGGHKGVSSIVEHLGTTQFPRIKIGIGRPRYGESAEDYVLAPCYSDEKTIMEKAIKLAVRACESFVSDGVESAMRRINCQDLANKNKEVRS